jgi:putative DNA primase/helicase
MREDFWEFLPTHKFWIAANHKPIVRGTDYAIWRRLLLIPFTITFDGAKKDPQLAEKLSAELPGILRWAIEGCLAWQAEGSNPPPEVLAEVARYREEQDVLGAFLEERCVTRAGASVQATALYQCYVDWCRASGEEAIKQRAFGLAMTERGYERRKDRRGAQTYLGISVDGGW